MCGLLPGDAGLGDRGPRAAPSAPHRPACVSYPQVHLPVGWRQTEKGDPVWAKSRAASFHLWPVFQCPSPLKIQAVEFRKPGSRGGVPQTFEDRVATPGSPCLLHGCSSITLAQEDLEKPSPCQQGGPSKPAQPQLPSSPLCRGETTAGSMPLKPWWERPMGEAAELAISSLRPRPGLVLVLCLL